MNNPRPVRRPLSQDEIEQRLAKAYDLLYRVGLRAQAQRDALRQEVHLVPPADSSTPDSAARRDGDVKDPTHGDQDNR